MKITIRTIISLLLFSLIIVACKKDKDNENSPAKNYFKLDNVEYLLSQGILENFGKADTSSGFNYEGYNLDLTLFSSGIILTNISDTMFDVLGSGHIIYFEMFSSNDSYLDNGEYNFDLTQPAPVGSFDNADITINFDVYNQNNDFIEITSGKVTVSRSGSIYEITINCTDQNGGNVTGYYRGTLKYFNYDTKLKSNWKNLFKNLID